jgi:hypothetical protein
MAQFNAARKLPNDQAHPPPEAERGTNGAVGSRVQRLVVLLVGHYRSLHFLQRADSLHRYDDH